MIEEFLLFIIGLIGFVFLWFIAEEILFRKPKRVQKVPRKKRKMFRLKDERWGGIFQVVKKEHIEPERYLLHLKSGKMYIKVPYYTWEIEPENPIEALTSPATTIFRWVGESKNNKKNSFFQRYVQARKEAELLKKKVKELEAYEHKLAHNVMTEARNFVKAKEEYKPAKS